MQTRKQLLTWIRNHPGEVLDDLTMLRQELTTEKILNVQMEKRLKIAEFISTRYVARLSEAKKQLALVDAIMLNKKV